MLFDLFKKKNKEPEFLFNSLKVDMHSHLIPGIDDGAQNLEESIALTKAFIDLGFKKIITTPHIMADYYRNTPDIVLEGLDLWREELHKQNINIEVEAAAEYYLDEAFENKLDKGNLLTMGNNYLLFELSFINFPNNMEDMVKKMNDKGYKPILAHPERYPYLYSSIDLYYQIKEYGCYFQMNTIALTGHYGKQTQKIAEQLVESNLIDFLGSDMHRLQHAIALKESLHHPLLKKLLFEHSLMNERLL